MQRRRGSQPLTQQVSNRVSRTQDELDQRDELANLARWSFRAINGIGAILLIFFGWLQFRYTPVIAYIQNTTPDILIKGTLVLYYACWIGGCSFETWMQQKVYVSDPGRGKITADLLGAIAAMGAAAFALVWASSHQQFFSLVLFGFTVVNIVGWYLIVSRIRPIIAASRKELAPKQSFFRLEQIRMIELHMLGSWQKWRFAGMVVISLFGILVYYSTSIRLFIARLIDSSPLAIPTNTAADLLPPAIYLCFVLFAESWIWIRRENIRAMLSATDRLKQHYIMKPLTEEVYERKSTSLPLNKPNF